MIRRIHDESAGFIFDMSQILAVEALKDPGLFPHVQQTEGLVIFSDYSEGMGTHKTYSFLVTTMSEMKRFNQERVTIRKRFNLGTRRLSFKGMNDRVKLRALPEFLELVESLSGFVLTIAVQASTGPLFAPVFASCWPELAKLKQKTLEELLRVVHFGSLAILSARYSGRTAYWFTDSDDIVANEILRQHFGGLAQMSLNLMYKSKDDAPALLFGITDLDAGSLDIEDLASVPDLIAGATCEALDRLVLGGSKVVSRLAATAPKVSAKTNLICSWAARGNLASSVRNFGAG